MTQTHSESLRCEDGTLPMHSLCLTDPIYYAFLEFECVSQQPKLAVRYSWSFLR
jgi:hypothetical protein